MLLEWNPETRREEWRLIENPTIGDIRRLRNKGAIILRQVIHKYGHEIHKDWVTDNGRSVVSSIEYKPCTCCKHCR